MAKLCENIICGDMRLFKNEKNELICRTSTDTEIVSEHCTDFDACTDADNIIHIGTADEKGNLVYIRHISGHWGRGIAARKVDAENIFISALGNGIVIFYTSKNKLFSLKIDNDLHEPDLVSEITPSSFPFCDGKNIYYTNNRGVLCKNREELCSGREISHIFATSGLVCFKDKDELKILDERTEHSQKSLTRRHGRRAQCPLIMHTGNRQILAWLDGNKMLSSQKEDESWQRLEETALDNYDNAAIFKLCNRTSFQYCIGFLKNNEPIFPHRKPSTPISQADAITHKVNPQNSKPTDTLSLQLLGELREIRKKLIELDEKLEKTKKNQTVQIIRKESSTPKKTSLYKSHKK